MESPSSTQELSSIAGLFISTPEEKKSPPSNVSELKGETWGNPRQDCEVDETVTVRKRIAYPGTRNGQETLRKSLQGFLDGGYSISRIELKKTTESLRPGNRTVTNEEIALYLK